MNKDFGNLRDWARVLEKLDEITLLNQLDEYQDELTRILRYKQNWKLRETVLLCVRDLNYPCDDILEALCNIMYDYDIYLEARVMAVNALGILADRISSYPHDNRSFDKEKIIATMNETLALPQAPLLSNAIEQNLYKLLGKS